MTAISTSTYERVRKEPGGDWQLYAQLAKSRLQLQQGRIQMESRMRKMIEIKLVDMGLFKEIIERKVDGVTGSEAIGKTYKPVNDEDDTVRDIIAAKKKIKEFPAYQVMERHYKQLFKQEKQMGIDAAEMIHETPLYRFCETVRGLAEISALTFMGYYNPELTRSISNWLSMLGWTPTSKKVRGQQSKSNYKAKGKTWMATNSVIMQKDPYYFELYHLKKAYYYERPDLIYKRDVKKEKGWRGHIDAMARRFNTKLLLSQAFELMYKDYWGVEFHDSEAGRACRHRNYIPRKDQLTAGEDDYIKIHTRFKKVHDGFLADLRIKWEEDKTPDKSEYFEFLRHGEIEKYMN